MEKFEEILKKATARGSNVVPGAAVAVVDKDGRVALRHLRLPQLTETRKLCL